LAEGIRGAFGLGLTWAAVWGAFGALLGLVMGFPEFGIDVAVFFAWRDAAMGFVGGATFASVLRLAEGRRRFDELRLPRFAAWGGLGGFLIGAGYWGGWWILSGIAPDMAAVQWLAVPTLLGAASASGSLVLARVADDRQLLEEGAEAADIGLSPDERRTLLGDS
jgi:hypothetical protein